MEEFEFFNLSMSTTNSNDNISTDDETNVIKLTNNESINKESINKESINNKESIEKESINKESNGKNDLIKLLSKTPSKSDSNSCRIIIDLNNILRHTIIGQLIKNEYFICSNDEIDTNLTKELIKENNYLITKLISLPNNDAIKEESKLEFKDIKLVNELKAEISNLNQQTRSLKEEISTLKNKLDDKIIEIHRFEKQLNLNSSVRLNCIKKDIKNFFENDNRCFSEPITFLNIKWYIYMKSKCYDDDKKRYLGFYLYAINNIDTNNKVKWKSITSFDLILKNNLPNGRDKINKCDFIFNRTVAHGIEKFISKDELFNLENGYLIDNSIKLEIYLRVDKIERNI